VKRDVPSRGARRPAHSGRRRRQVVVAAGLFLAGCSGTESVTSDDASSIGDASIASDASPEPDATTVDAESLDSALLDAADSGRDAAGLRDASADGSAPSDASGDEAANEDADHTPDATEGNDAASADAADASAAADTSTPDANTPDASTPDTSTAIDATTPADATSAADAAAESGISVDASDAASPVDSGACALGHVVISEIRSRGLGGATDEFVELYNPTATPVTLDSAWVIQSRSSTAATYSTCWTGSGKSVPAYGHYLIAGTGYVQTPTKDDTLVVGITDAASLQLIQSSSAIDAVCFSFDVAGSTALMGVGYVCEGTPVSNLPHDNTTSSASNSDVSIERRPGGAGGNCTDTGDNASDFETQAPATPQDTTSNPTP
jgi:hypothetical protein